ncbi:Fcf2-domain-containing protein [Gonapodya prolifera JEL478]|uniref:Fcf2-domain-containing protein n=1 Tax=Gonapodya prolifera (strain JEL478) TaxID=1344416 RepID=A0A139A832_GONPJ|nr:Fcf2-domain-containing protein [Gonapodya prolifera JEL478]|eukprot:KXS12605.1 Fcf2-domain-containing protein [Gonapodya prolifera JEL478]
MLRIFDAGSDISAASATYRDEDEEHSSQDEEDSEDLNELIAIATRQLKRKRAEDDDGRDHGESSGTGQDVRSSKKKPTVRVSSRLDAGVSHLALPLQPTSASASISQTTGAVMLGSKTALELDAVVRDKDSRKLVTGDDKKTDDSVTTTGSKWFDMKTPALTPELKRDLQLLKLRGVLDPKQFFKKEDKKGKDLPKHFQVATIVDSPHEFFSARLSARERKQTLVEEVMADVDRRKWYKKRYNEVQTKATSGGKQWFKRKTEKRKPSSQRT